jgi:hypothetical protein
MYACTYDLLTHVVLNRLLKSNERVQLLYRDERVVLLSQPGLSVIFKMWKLDYEEVLLLKNTNYI